MFLCTAVMCIESPGSISTMTPMRPEEVKNTCLGASVPSCDTSEEVNEPAKAIRLCR